MFARLSVQVDLLSNNGFSQLLASVKQENRLVSIVLHTNQVDVGKVGSVNCSIYVNVIKTKTLKHE